MWAWWKKRVRKTQEWTGIHGLTGPEGEWTLEGLHTRGENDLMVRVVGRVPDGEYLAKWKAQGDDGHVRQGEWKFTLKRGG